MSISANSISMVSGIDALYYQLSISQEYYTTFFNNCKSNKPTTLNSFRMTSDNWDKQYTWFELICPKEDRIIARVGFKNLNDKDNLEFVMVQMDSYYMNVNGVKESYYLVVEHIEALGLMVQFSKVSRLDLNTYVYGYDFSYLTFNHFSTLVRVNTKIYSSNKDNLSTIYLGSRKNNSAPLLRIYDKWLELKETDKKCDKQAMIRWKFQEAHRINLDDRIPLWNVEFELKRELLKIYGINAVEDVFTHSNKLHTEIIKRYRLMTKKKRNDEKHADRIPTAPVWKRIAKEYNFMDSNIPVERRVEIIYKKDIQWLLNRVEDYVKAEADHYTINEIALLVAQKIQEVRGLREDDREVS